MKILNLNKDTPFKIYWYIRSYNLILFSVILLFSGCIKAEDDKSLVSLVKVGTLNLKLDSKTINSVSNLSLFFNEKDSSNCVVFQNIRRNKIWFYEIKDRNSPKYEVTFDKEGPNGIGKLEGFYIHSLDSIYVIPFFHSEVFLVNKEGKILKKYSFGTNQKRLSGSPTSSPYSSTHAPMVKVGDTLYVGAVPDVASYLNNYTAKIKLALNIKNGGYKYLHAYPKIYADNYWGRTHMFFPNVYDDRIKKFIYSFPIGDSLYTIGINQKIQAFRANSSRFDKIQPMDGYTKNREKTRTYLYKTPIYTNIIIDKDTDVYYRVAEQATSNFDLHKVGKMKRSASIIVLDRKFNKIGETLIGDGYRVNSLFTYRGSLFILKEVQDDDVLSFDEYKLETNE